MDVSFMESVPTIPEFFNGRNVFVTGASGFIGKVLLEKLLRSCPGVENIYILMREKKGKCMSERVNHIVGQDLFTQLKEHTPEAIKKIVPIAGDVSKIGLGLSENDRNLIINKVSVVFHVAASVRFDDPLKKAVFQNVRSTKEVIHLVEELKDIAVFVHVSTAYSNCDRMVIEECLYPTHVDWREMIKVAEDSDENVLQYLTEKYTKPYPNTYTFTKSLAEHVVNDMCNGKFPAVILRPSIVVSSIAEPVPGWVDNFNGPYSFLTGSGIGLVRIIYGAKEHVLDHVPIDNFIKSLITATWVKAIERDNTKEITIYNCCSDIRESLNFYRKEGLRIVEKYPFEKKFWCPVQNNPFTVCWYNYFVNFILFQLLPAIILDSFLIILGKKIRLVPIQRKIYIANVSLSYFMTKDTIFKTENYNSLSNKLLKNDRQTFTSILFSQQKATEEYNINALVGIKKYLLKEALPVPQKTLRIDKAFRILDEAVKYIWYAFVLYIIYCNLHITRLLENFYVYIESL